MAIGPANSNTSNLRFEDVESETMVINLDLSESPAQPDQPVHPLDPASHVFGAGIFNREAFQSPLQLLPLYYTGRVDEVVRLLPAMVRGCGS
jgi:hypothetical protein